MTPLPLCSGVSQHEAIVWVLFTFLAGMLIGWCMHLIWAEVGRE